MEHSDHIAFVPESVSVRHRVCCCTLFNGRLTRFTLFNVCVNHGSGLEPRTTLTVDRGAKAAAEAGSNETGMVLYVVGARRCDIRWDGSKDERKKQKRALRNVSGGYNFFVLAGG
jgi:hypothetical protein